MTKKTSPIADYKEEDVTLMRKMLLTIINNDKLNEKDRIEASKLLLRAHHALQIDRSVTAKAVAQQAQKIESKVSKEEAQIIQDLLNA